MYLLITHYFYFYTVYALCVTRPLVFRPTSTPQAQFGRFRRQFTTNGKQLSRFTSRNQRAERKNFDVWPIALCTKKKTCSS